MGPQREQAGIDAKATTVEDLREGGAGLGHRSTVVLPCIVFGGHAPGFVDGKEYAGLLEDLAHGSDDETARLVLRRRHALGIERIADPGDVHVAIRIVNASAGEDVHTRSEGHAGCTSHQVGLEPPGIAQEHNSGRIPERRWLPLSGEQRAGALTHLAGHARDAQSATSSTISTSTGALMGSPATPTADRACRPASPKISSSNSLAPLMTAG